MAAWRESIVTVITASVNMDMERRVTEAKDVSNITNNHKVAFILSSSADLNVEKIFGFDFLCF